MKTRIWYKSLIFIIIILLPTLAVLAEPQSPKVVRVINSANPEPPIYNWHPHNRLGIEKGAFAGVKSFNRVLIREENGDVLEVPFFHFTARDLGEIMNRMAKFPSETKVIDYTPGESPIVELHAANLNLGPLEKWPNQGVIGGNFHSMNVPPVVEDINGRRAVHFDCNQWYFDTRYNAMVLDTMPVDALKDGKPFTLSVWVLHPKDPDPDDGEMIMSWHTRGGNNGTGLDWRMSGAWGDFSVGGLGTDLTMDPPYTAKPMTEWTHMAYVYTGGGINGELRLYINGRLTGIARSQFLPEFRDPSDITTNSVVIKGYLNTISEDVAAYVRGYIGEYDAHHFGQLRHIGRWDQMKEIGLTKRGEFSIPFSDLKPGTRYYYRIFASLNPESYVQPYDPTRRWANGVGSFITATADGKPGQILPIDQDRYIFLGVQWGSRWYLSYPGPAGFFRGYISDLKLYDRALSDEEIRRDANMLAAYDGTPKDGSRILVDSTDFTWKSGTSAAAKYRFYLTTDKEKIANETTNFQEVAECKIANVKLTPGRTHYWRIDTLDANGNILAKGQIWQFHVAYGEPTNPNPEDKSSTSATGYFRWVQTINTIRDQKLLYSTDPDAVEKGTASIINIGKDSRECFAPNKAILPGETWYWRVETVLSDGQVVPGPIWSFNTIDYFTPEFDGPVSEPYPEGITPSRASKVIKSLGYPTISTPRADEASLRDIAHATKRFLQKSVELRNMLASHPCATTISSQEGPPCVDGFWCGSYGGLPNWNMTMHEMGHQILMNGLGPMEPDFYNRLKEVFNSHANNNAWLGDYASANIDENIACSAHQFISGTGREALLKDDPPTYYLLAQYMPGDLAVELHTAYGLTINEAGNITQWKNRGGVEDRVANGQGYAPMVNTVGTFKAIGMPKLCTTDGATAIAFGGSDAFIWDRGLQYGFEGNRAWSVEIWAYKTSEVSKDELLVGWGPADKGVRFYWGKSSRVWNVGDNESDWPIKPTLGKWHHIVFIFEGGGLQNTEGAMRLFLDGTEILNKAYKLNLAPNMPVELGGIVSEGNVESGFNGAISHIRIYNYAISYSQVTEHYTTERRGYERTSPPNIGGRLLVDLDATQLEETGTEDHFPLYPASLHKPWVRSWANRGILQGRFYNDVTNQWHYSGSTPIYKEVAGIQAVQFAGKDHMIGLTSYCLPAIKIGTIEATVFSDAASPDEVIMEWGNFVLDASFLNKGWQHIAVTFSETKPSVFVNGIKVGEITTAAIQNNSDHIHLGGHFDLLRERWSRHFNGALAEIRIHEQTLTPDQILSNANCSPALAAHTPNPPNGAKVVVARKPALSWIPGLNTKEAEPVFLGEDSKKLELLGTFKPGELKPNLSSNKRYFWKVGNGPVWSFETTYGELVNLSANGLADGTLSSWQNKGIAGGAFVPANRGNLLGMDVKIYNGVKALRLTKGKSMRFQTDAKKLQTDHNNQFTISFRVTSDNWTEESPILSFGKQGAETRIWFGTGAEDRRMLTVGGSVPLPIDQRYSNDQLKMIYPEGCNARMTYVWKTITLTYNNGIAELWYNRHRIDRRKIDLSSNVLDNLVFGWDAPQCNGNIFLNNLQIYDRALKQTDIEQLINHKNVDKTNPIIYITADDLESGSRIASLKNHGTLKGIFTTQPEIDRRPKVGQTNGRKAVIFDGKAMMTSTFILPDALANAKPFTVEIWALQDEPSQDARLLAFSQETSERHTSFAMGSTADARSIVRTFSSADWKIDPEEQVKQWVHLAWVYEGGQFSKIRLYRNGKLNAEYDFKTIDTIGGYPMSIGGIMSPALAEKSLFKGAIAEIRIFDYPRTPEEIATDATLN